MQIPSLPERAQAFAAVLRGERFSPEQVEAVIKGAKQDATKAARRVSAGRALGAGKSRGGFSTAKDESFRSAILDHMASLKSGGR